MSLQNLKKCLTCKLEKPKTKEFWRFDKRRTEPYGSCKDCINRRRSLHRKVKRISDYDTDFGISKRVRSKITDKDFIEAQRTRLILLDRIKNGCHLILNNDHLYCKICKNQQQIILPISLNLLQESIKAFKKIHKHEKGI
jgi:hypothetical protein